MLHNLVIDMHSITIFKKCTANQIISERVNSVMFVFN